MGIFHVKKVNPENVSILHVSIMLMRLIRLIFMNTLYSSDMISPS